MRYNFGKEEIYSELKCLCETEILTPAPLPLSDKHHI